MAKLSRILLICFVLSVMIGTSINVGRAQDDGTGDTLTRYSEELYVSINQGLIGLEERPLQRNETLDAVAQVIADELGATGSYGSVPPVLADNLGYPRWPDNGQRVISLPYNGIGIQTPAEAADYWVEAIAETLAESYFREIGIGVSNYVAQAGGTVQTAYAIVLGAQPNVIPVVVNDGAAKVYSQEVELFVHNELTLSYETDPTVLQRANEVRFASSETELATATWQIWDDLNFAVPWQLTDGLGAKEVWVELRDAKGATVKSVANIEFADPATSPDAATLPAPSPITLVMTYGGDTFTLQGFDMPYILIHFDHQVQVFQVRIFNANGSPVHPVHNFALRQEYLPRNSTTTGFFAFAWDGTRLQDNGNDKVKLVADGQYYLVVEALKANGDANNPAHWETWTSPVINIDRP